MRYWHSLIWIKPIQDVDDGFSNPDWVICHEWVAYVKTMFYNQLGYKYPVNRTGFSYIIVYAAAYEPSRFSHINIFL